MEGAGVGGHVPGQRLGPNTLPNRCRVKTSISLFDTKFERINNSSFKSKPHEVAIDDRVEDGVIHCVVDVAVLVIVKPPRLYREEPGVDTLPRPVQFT